MQKLNQNKKIIMQKLNKKIKKLNKFNLNNKKIHF